MMKRINQIVKKGWLAALVLTFIVLLQGCKGFRVGNHFLAKPPSSGESLDSVFSNPVTAKQVLWHAYQTLPWGSLTIAGPYDTNVLCDDPLAAVTDIDQSYVSNDAGPNFYYPGSYSPTTPTGCAIYNFSGGEWQGIRYAYIFINNIGKTPGIPEHTKKRLKAEARLIIAIHYTDLFRNFGGMIWVGHAYTPNENFHKPRMTAMATLDSTLMLLNKVIHNPDLPWALKNSQANSGRLTKASAMGLKVRLLLFAASPLFNSNKPYMAGEASNKKLVWYGSYHPELWDSVVVAAKAFIDKNHKEGMPYHLVDTGHPRKDFRKAYYDRNSPELLIQVQKRYTASGMPIAYTTGNNKGAIDPTDNYVKMFPMADGTPIHAPGSGYDPAHPYKNRDPRLYETVLVNGDKYKGRTAELYIGGLERLSKNNRGTRSGYRLRKYVLDAVKSRNHPIEFPYLRLPEIYLSYAEALDEANGGPTQEACEYVNKVRNRVDLDDLKGCMDMTKKEFRKR